MRKRMWGIAGMLLLVLVMMTGCATTGNQTSIVTNVVQWDAQNAVNTRAAAVQIGKTWALNSSALKVILTKFKGLLPCDCDADIKVLDDLTAKCVNVGPDGGLTCAELTDKDMGTIVVEWAWVWGTIAKSGVEQVMQTLFPAVLAKIMPYVTALGL